MTYPPAHAHLVCAFSLEKALSVLNLGRHRPSYFNRTFFPPPRPQMESVHAFLTRVRRRRKTKKKRKTKPGRGWRRGRSESGVKAAPVPPCARCAASVSTPRPRPRSTTRARRTRGGCADWPRWSARVGLACISPIFVCHSRKNIRPSPDRVGVDRV